MLFLFSLLLGRSWVLQKGGAVQISFIQVFNQDLFLGLHQFCFRARTIYSLPDRFFTCYRRYLNQRNINIICFWLGGECFGKIRGFYDWISLYKYSFAVANNGAVLCWTLGWRRSKSIFKSGRLESKLWEISTEVELTDKPDFTWFVSCLNYNTTFLDLN